MVRRSGVTLTEALVTGLVIAATLPLMMQSGSTLVRMDQSRHQRAHAANLARIALEGMQYELYQGHCRGYKPHDEATKRRAAYAEESYLDCLEELEDADPFPDPPEELENYQQEIKITPYLDGPASSSDELGSKSGEEPKVDLVDVHVKITWKGPGGGPREKVFTTRMTRPVTELDPTLSLGGR